MSGRRASKKAKAPVPAFRQVVAPTGMQFVLAESVWNTSSQTPVLSKPNRQTAVPSAETPACPVLHMADESSLGEKEVASLKR